MRLRFQLQISAIAFVLAASAHVPVAQAQEIKAADLPYINGGYVLFKMGGHRLLLERDWTSAKRLPPFDSWKRNQPSIDEWQVLDSYLSYFAQKLDIATDKEQCRGVRLAITLRSEGSPYPGETYKGQYPKSRESEFPYLREFADPANSGAPLNGERYFFLAYPVLKMSNGEFPMTSCQEGQLGSCGVSFELQPNLFARFRYYPGSCGLDRLVETAVAIRKRLLERYTFNTGD
ncbi:hypothetical protein [Rhizobium sp. FKY42]|uniref:hypothetical protein n=1 Tax=Rhizobium sp. FKY42 TaxID=2562310 RepID=UPI0010C0DE49|nr:hypothetical protein [Rhizobium sp. FKY42]